MVTVNNYYNNIPVGRDLNNLPNTSSAGTTVGYQYDGLTEEDRFVQKVLQEHYDKVYKENLSHSDPMTYICLLYTSHGNKEHLRYPPAVHLPIFLLETPDT